MRGTLLKSAKPAVLLAALLVATLVSGCKSSKLDEETLRGMIDTGLQATANRNATVLCDQIAEDAEIRLVVFKFSGSDIRTFTKGQWCDYLRESFSTEQVPGMTVNIHMDIQAIDIASDGKTAEINGNVVEEISFGGRRGIRMNSKQSYSVEMRKGKPKYVKLSARYTA